MKLAKVLPNYLSCSCFNKKKIEKDHSWLHDEIAQILTAVNFKLSMLSVTQLPQNWVNIIDAQQMLVKSVDKINTFAHELYPMILMI